jgi:outer membrane immunogenic protein
MKKLALASLAIGALMAPAVAADMPVRAVPPPLAPVYTWTGFYLGGTVGVGWTGSGIDNAVTSTFCNPLLVGCPAVGSALAAAVPPHFNTNPGGVIGGGEIGYNWQTGRIVWGVEADFSGASIKGSDMQNATAPIAGFPNTISGQGTATEKLDYFGTVRGRLGFTLTDPLLVYATGGFAFGHVASGTLLTEAASGGCFCGSSPTVAAAASSTLTGWTVGGGLEYMLTPSWTVKGEYLYYDLGSMSYALPGIVQLNAGGVPFYGAGVTSTTNVKGNIVRIGLNFKL